MHLCREECESPVDPTLNNWKAFRVRCTVHAQVLLSRCDSGGLCSSALDVTAGYALSVL